MNRKLLCSLIILSCAGIAAPTYADPHKDESGHGRRHKGGEYKEEYWDGDCKVERKWGKKGEYKEEVKCDRPRRVVREHEHRSGGGAIVIRPPAVIIEPPAVIIK